MPQTQIQGKFCPPTKNVTANLRPAELTELPALEAACLACNVNITAEEV